MIRAKDIEFVNRSLQICDKYKERGIYTMVSMLCEGKSIKSVGFNNYKKTHPNTPQIYDTHIIPTHAEVDCISRWIVKNRKITDDMTLYIVGYTKSVENRCVISSLPCQSCMIFISKIGIKRLVYTDNIEGALIIKEYLI